MECHNCGSEYEQPGRHWDQSSCSFPELTENQIEAAKGVLMGDGYLIREYKNPSLKVVNTRVDFLEWVQGIFSNHLSSISKIITAEKAAKIAKESRKDSRWGVHPEEYNDCFSLRIYANENFNQFRRWYDDGSIKFPDDIELTPMSLKAWYASDGGLQWPADTTPEPCVTTRNEQHRMEYLQSLFDNIGISTFINDHHLSVSADSVEDFFEFMGEPVPGYEYKWAHDDREKYYELKDGSEYQTKRRKLCIKYTDELGLPEYIAEEAYESIKNVDLREFGNYDTSQIVFCQVVLEANKNDIFIQKKREYKNLADELIGNLSYRNKIRTRLKEHNA